ncbi:hypothetical protein Dimus_031021 [Dionaea muscipula]
MRRAEERAQRKKSDGQDYFSPSLSQIGFLGFQVCIISPLRLCLSSHRPPFSEIGDQRPETRDDHAVTQDLPDQEEAGEEDEAEQTDPLLDPDAHWQHHPVQCQAQALAPN